MQSTFEVSIGERTFALEFSQIGGNDVSSQPDSGDSRPVLFPAGGN